MPDDPERGHVQPELADDGSPTLVGQAPADSVHGPGAHRPGWHFPTLHWPTGRTAGGRPVLQAPVRLVPVRLIPALREGEEPGSLLAFILVAALIGALTGVVAVGFKVSLHLVGRWRNELIAWGHGHWYGLPLLLVVCGSAAAAAAALVRCVEPHADGSGIPRVEAVVAGRTEFGRSRILPVKFLGGVLSIGAGLALGREGPLVQMGGNVAITVGRIGRRSRADLRVLVAAGAGAGLSTTFNAPIAGGVFVLEELLKHFHPRTTLATLAAAAAGFLTSRLLLPDEPDLPIAALAAPRIQEAPWVLLVGLVCGLGGVLYNKMLLGGLQTADRLRIPVELRAGSIGVGVGLLAWWLPTMVGGGDNLTVDALAAHGTILTVLGVLVLRAVIGAICYASGTPGGLFAPSLVLGSHCGLLVGLVAVALTPHHAPQPAALALVGLAAFFTSSVRAPVTGIILATEMTRTTVVLPPMLGACAVAMLVAMMLKCRPIYDALADRSVRAAELARAEGKG